MTDYKVGDPDPTADVAEDDFCESRSPEGLVCTRPIEHTPPHVAGDLVSIVAVWGESGEAPELVRVRDALAVLRSTSELRDARVEAFTAALLEAWQAGVPVPVLREVTGHSRQYIYRLIEGAKKA